MSRTDKLRKLSNAIRDYRGAYHQDTGIWIRRPKPMELGRVQLWLERLGINTTEGMVAIDGFKTLDEFRVWFRSIE